MLALRQPTAPRRRWWVSLIATAMAGTVVPADVAVAQPDPEGPRFSLTVSPTRIVVPADDLDKQAEVRLTNHGQQPVEVVVNKRDMWADEVGNLTFVDEVAYSATDWLTTDPERLLVPPGAAETVTVQVDLPTRYEPGDHHVALVFVAPNAEEQGTVQINRGVGIPVYVQAPGVVDRSVEFTDLSGPRFSLWGPVSFQASLQHTGTVHRDFRGGNQLLLDVDGSEVEVPEFTLLRDAAREVTVEWQQPPLWCVCRATLTIPDATGAGYQQRTATVVIVPVHLIGVVLAAVAGLVLLLVWRHRRRVGSR